MNGEQIPEGMARQASQVDQMVSVRKTPWHDLATVVYDDLNIGDVRDVQTALRLAGLDWKVERKVPMIPTRPSWSVMDLADARDFRAIVRDTDNKVFAIMRESYTPVQNIDAFAAVDDILGGLGAPLETAGSLSGGARVWLQARVPEVLAIDGDVHYPFITFSNSHDGSAACRVDITAVRAECRNSIRIGRDESGASLSLRHTRNVNTRLRTAGDVLGLVDRFTAQFTRDVEELMSRNVSFDREMDKLFGARPSTLRARTERQQANIDARREAIRRFYESPIDGGSWKGTAWGVLNAVNSYELWEAPARGDRQARTLTRLTSGQNLPLTARAARLLG